MVIGNTHTAADKDVWIKKEVLPDAKEYYSMVLVYIGDILCIHKDTSVVIDALASIYVMKWEVWAHQPLLGSKH
jgi:acyl-CoA thioesterase